MSLRTENSTPDSFLKGLCYTLTPVTLQSGNSRNCRPCINPYISCRSSAAWTEGVTASVSLQPPVKTPLSSYAAPYLHLQCPNLSTSCYIQGDKCLSHSGDRFHALHETSVLKQARRGSHRQTRHFLLHLIDKLISLRK